MARPKYNRPTDAELQILQILWKNPGGMIVRQVFNELKKLRGNGYNSALKLMQIMTDKGLIKRDDSQRPQRYRATRSCESMQLFLLKDFLNRVYGGDVGSLRRHLGSEA